MTSSSNPLYVRFLLEVVELLKGHDKRSDTIHAVTTGKSMTNS